MPRTLLAVAFSFAILVIYLLLWPVPIEPVAWTAPADRGLIDPFEANDRLQRARIVSLGDHAGPEDIAAGADGWLYTGTQDGTILRFDSQGTRQEIFATPGGWPLGLDFDLDGRLLVANAALGLQRITADGQVETLLTDFDGVPLGYVNDVAVHPDGSIYFTDSSSKWSARAAGGPYAASLLDIIEHGGHGRVFRLDPAQNVATLVLDGLHFANGIAVSADGRFLMISETGSYRVLRHWLGGERTGATEAVAENLPGFPDNINNGLNDRFWVGLVMPRSNLVDDMSARPWLRKVIQRLPARLQPQPGRAAHVIAITGDGEILMNFQDTARKLDAITGVCETRNAIWLSSQVGNRLGRLDKQDLAEP